MSTALQGRPFAASAEACGCARPGGPGAVPRAVRRQPEDSVGWPCLQFYNHKMSAEQLIPLSAAMLPDAIQVADAFHVVRLGNAGVDDVRRRSQVIAWHHVGVSNGPTESMNNLAKRIKRIAFGMTNFRNWRIRVLLYDGRPDWSLLPGITPLPC